MLRVLLAVPETVSPGQKKKKPNSAYRHNGRSGRSGTYKTDETPKLIPSNDICFGYGGPTPTPRGETYDEIDPRWGDKKAEFDAPDSE